MITDREGSVTDAELVSWFRRDPQQFTHVHDRYYRDIHRYVAGRLDRHVAEDIVAETFLTAFDRRDTFDPERGALRPWLFGIATKLVAGHRRAEARRYRAMARLGIEPAAEGHEQQVVTAVVAQRRLPELASALAGLSARERDVVLLVALGQLGYEEVAEALGISSGTVGSRLSRARRKLSAALAEEAVDG